MAKIKFSEGLEAVIRKDDRYARDAYIFLKDALDFTIHRHRRQYASKNQHVTPQELLDGIRDYALEEFGPAVELVFEHWNVQNTRDFGNMVFNLVDAGVFGVQETDKIEDFEGYYDFEKAFSEPFVNEHAANRN